MMLLIPDDYINEFFRRVPAEVIGGEYPSQRPREKLICVSGLELSVQASAFHYCNPRLDGADEYSSVEIGFPPYAIDLLKPFAEDREDLTGTVYGHVPTDVINSIIGAHGGVDYKAMGVPDD